MRLLRKIPRWFRDLSLPTAALLSGAGLLGVALFVLWITGRPLGGPLYLWHIEPMLWKDRLTYAGAVATGVGAMVALVVSYRKQGDAEEGKFAAQFAAAAAQLGDDAPAVRIAGAFAIAALADRHKTRRQQCIDVLTGYIRLPYEPHDGHRVGRATQRTIGVDGDQATVTDTNAYRPADREVRLTIIRIIRDHLQDPDSAAAWCGHDLNFTGATFDGADFTGAHFTGCRVDFSGAALSGGRVDFGEAAFSGANIYFSGATFSGGYISFDAATFSAGTIDFSLAMFTGGDVGFTFAKFGGSEVRFDESALSGGNVSFDFAEFGAGRIIFFGAAFSGAEVSFEAAEFSGSEVSFFGAEVDGSEVGFDSATFEGSTVSFATAALSRGRVSFDGAAFSRGEVHFFAAEFSGAEVSRDGQAFFGWSEKDGFLPDPREAAEPVQ